MKKTNLTVFLDAVGRTIVGEATDTTAKTISVKNPAIILAQPDPQQGRLSLQAMPVFFNEFLRSAEEGTVWTYNKANITICDHIDLIDKFVEQYDAIFGNAASAKEEVESVEMFDK